jgi:regulator of replication initiation timing
VTPIQSLEQTIQKQVEQIENLSAQLQETMKQAQSLAMKAFESSANSNSKEQVK